MSFIMGDPKTVLEGSVKYRDKKKWKSRWAVVSKLSPVADCLHIQLYRDSKERCKNGPTKASLSLEEFLGMETGFTLDKESNTMALICSELVVVLAFDNRELLIQWQVKIRANLVEEQQFLVQIAHVPPKSKLPCGPARLHLQDYNFCLVSGVPPRLLGTWPIKELRRFGVIEGKFCFEGGSLCGRGEGLHVLLTNQSEEMSQAMDLASKGKLLGKRKTLSRKNSVLETSSRIPLHKRHRETSKGTTCDSNRPLLSSGSEGSTCDACSEILRSTDPCSDELLVYTSSGSSIKASSCRIHYRWPSCLSRWGQSSTTTTSDVESMDTVSVTLSDFQGPSHAATMTKTNGHGQSMSCLCDSQGTWPFNQCSRCGRHFYSRNSLQSNRSAGHRKASSPDPTEVPNGFSPQWTMDGHIGSLSGDAPTNHKDSCYQMMKPPSSDRASLCSHASHSSTASSSGSEYSVPRNYLESLYDRPKSVQHSLNQKNGSPKSNHGSLDRTSLNQSSLEDCMLCPCHEPIKDWMSSSMSSSQEKLFGAQKCSCWNKLSMTLGGDVHVLNSRKSASATPSPSSSPKKSKYNNGVCVDGDVSCTCGKGDPYANYSVPRSALLSLKDKSMPLLQTNGHKEVKSNGSDPSDDYDVPKKFTDMLSNCDMSQNACAMQSLGNGTACSCMSTCKVVQNIEFFKMASKYSYTHPHNRPSTANSLQMCACQRVMLWAGSLVPCLGPQKSAVESGWQGAKQPEGKRAWPNNSAAVCSEPSKSATVVMVNGKPRHVLHHGASMDAASGTAAAVQNGSRPRANTISYPLGACHKDSKYRYAQVEASEDPKGGVLIASDDSSSVNYANIEFGETLPLYENSNMVLSRLDNPESNSETANDKPPLPPRQPNTPKKPSDQPQAESNSHKCAHRSPKKAALQPVFNGSAYEMMCYQKNPNCSHMDDDYLMMQPLCQKESESSPSKRISQDSDDSLSSIKTSDATELERAGESRLPLRPFMPYAYPSSETNGVNNHESGISSGEMLSRKDQLINEDLNVRSMRSNSFSELKKKVLMRKRSSSVDGKNNGYDVSSEAESVPATPVSSPKPSVQRKHSLFSKLNLRSKEKSMSTNEIIPPLPVTSCSSSLLNTVQKNGFHRSADCLKLSEEYANSDEDLNSDNSDFISQKETPLSMKRSSSVPCRSSLPDGNISSPLRNNETILEMNDLNKDSIPECTNGDVSENSEPVQRKYSLDSKRPVIHGVKSNCDNIYGQECLDECDAVVEMQGMLRKHHTQLPSSSDTNRSTTSSCSSSDISDYMESLSFISRSSSSSSGSADYMRSEDLYMLRPAAPKPCKGTTAGSYNVTVPAVHHTRRSPVDPTEHSLTHHPCTATSRYPKEPHETGVAFLRSNRDSRSSTSSTSSLSTSPSVTDYSSSSSSSSSLGQGNLMTSVPRVAGDSQPVAQTCGKHAEACTKK